MASERLPGYPAKHENLLVANVTGKKANPNHTHSLLSDANNQTYHNNTFQNILKSGKMKLPFPNQTQELHEDSGAQESSPCFCSWRTGKAHRYWKLSCLAKSFRDCSLEESLMDLSQSLEAISLVVIWNIYLYLLNFVCRDRQTYCIYCKL